MIDYIKFLILAIFSGIFAPLPVSSSAQFSFVNSVLVFSDDGKLLGFYYSVFMLVFSFAVFFSLRKIYISILRAGLSGGNGNINSAYRKRLKNILLSLIPVVVLFVPVGEGTLLSDISDRLLTPESQFIVAVASVLCGAFLAVSIWYTRQLNKKGIRSTKTGDVMRMSFYNLVCQMIPGLSKTAFASTNLLVSDVDSSVVVREIYLYLAPQIFLFNLLKIIRALLSGIVVDPVLLAISVVVVFMCSMLIISLVAKINIRRLFAFFSIYSVLFGVFAGIITFII